ncbi:MAG: hypothetical protein PHE25_06165 [Candidatus Gracilibacteria bacterium]|nr:hypothetical protein [Candidatus Gracilibacteria bacterium]
MFETEKVVEIKTCRHCNSSFEITDKDLEFYQKVSPSFGGKKYNIPSPSLCPDCRQQRRLSFRNEKKLYKRRCDATGKEIISIYSPDKPYKVYEQSYWWSDNWNPLDYGRDFDFSKSFFSQFDELMKEIPKIAIFRDKSMENSDYSNYGQYCKNTYLCNNCYNLSNSYYSTSCFPFIHNEETQNIDCEDCNDSSFIYECIDLKESYNCFYSNKLEGCNDCYFCDNLFGCSFCLFSINQKNKKLLFLNNQITKDEFIKVKEKILTDNKYKDEVLSKYELLKDKSPQLYCRNKNFQNVFGDNIINSKNLKNCFFVGSTENSKFLYVSGYFSKNMYDGMNSGGKSELTYETLHMHGNYKSCFIIDIDDSKNCYYDFQCFSCQDCFGCIGLRNKSYCILNKQYTKEEYEVLVPKIIEHMMKTGEWGEFFPSSLSPFGYNETVAQEYFPISRDKALPYLYKWSDYEPPFPKVDKIIPANKLPEDIKDIPDDILNWAIECEITKKPFRIISQELEFYRKHNLPIPKRHPDQRHLDRMALRNPRKLFDRKCDKCGKDIKTTYSPDRKEIVYCEECYNKEVY